VLGATWAASEARTAGGPRRTATYLRTAPGRPP
jgi:hypothetical protein